MTTSLNEQLSQITNNASDEFVSYMIIAIILVLVSVMISYIIYLNKLEGSECNFMNGLYPSVDGSIRSINPGDPNCGGSLYDYYIKTAYNACSGGTYKNDFVDLCNLKAVIKQGVRGLDFEIYSLDNNPIVATSTSGNYFVKETFNSVNFSDVMSTIQNYAFSNGTSPNPNDPIILHLRFMSNNQQMYSNLANIFKSYDSRMLGSQYSFENNGHNLGNVPLISLMGKIILIVDKTNNAFLENTAFLEYVNMTSNSVFMRALTYYNVKNAPDLNELISFNKTGMTIALPDSGPNPSNPSGLLCRAAGCQMVAIRYQNVDNLLEENALFFDEGGYAFVLKPANLRYIPVTVAPPTQQNPNYSYATRNATTDYYSFNF